MVLSLCIVYDNNWAIQYISESSKGKKILRKQELSGASKQKHLAMSHSFGSLICRVAVNVYLELKELFQHLHVLHIPLRLTFYNTKRYVFI